jgi:ADP-heptose:LPS heptosyltransferase
MFRTLFARLRQFSRQRRQQRRIAALSQCDATALASQAPPTPGRVLVVRNDSIGDYLLYRSWLRQLSAVLRQRGQRLTLVANALWAPLAQAWDGDIVDEFIPVQFGRFTTDLAYRAEMVARIGQVGAGEVLYPVHVREPAAENFIRFLHAPVRVASQGVHVQDAWFALLDAGYTCLLPTTRAVLFEYDRNREFFENWQQAPFSTPKVTLPPVPAPALALPAAVQASSTALAAAGPYIVLFPGASARQKRWPARRFGELAQALHRRYGAQYRLVVAGSPGDSAYVPAIAQAAGPGVLLDNQCGQTDLPGLAALIAGAQLLISNDTVAAHLAAQAGTPCLVLLMGENYGKFFPYPPALLRAPCRCLFPPGQEARFALGDFSPPAHDPAIGQIAPGRVLEAAAELLG